VALLAHAVGFGALSLLPRARQLPSSGLPLRRT